mmetsp:Transcript_29314/g.95542  ORF Transcript_29314/g.95542 Transcript_29314/m.95542 type:complete len:234 (+) Transcript_29314:473-1174(+)
MSPKSLREMVPWSAFSSRFNHIWAPAWIETTALASRLGSLRDSLMISSAAGRVLPFFHGTSKARSGSSMAARSAARACSLSRHPASPLPTSAARATVEAQRRAHVSPAHDQPGRAPEADAGRAKTESKSPRRHIYSMARIGSLARSMPSSSFPTRSRLTLLLRAVIISASDAASERSGSSSKPKRDAKRIARRTRRGSSRKVVLGASGVRIMPARRSLTPRPVKSSMLRVCRL